MPFTSSPVALLDSIVYNNAGAIAFEKGSLPKAKRLFSKALKSIRDENKPKSGSKSSSRSNKQHSKYLRSKSFSVEPSMPVASKKSKQCEQSGSIITSSTTESLYLYQRVFRIRCCKYVDNIDHIIEITSVILFNRAMLYHCLAGGKRRILKKALYYYQCSCSIASTEDSVLELAIWNNMLQIFSSDFSNFESAQVCVLNLQENYNLVERGQLSDCDRRIFLFNLVFSQPTMAAAA